MARFNSEEEREAAMTKAAKTWMKRLVILVIALVVFFGSFYIVGPGQVGVLFNSLNGKTSVCKSGSGLKIPFIQSMHIFNVQTQRVDVREEGASKDLQKVIMNMAIRFHLDFERVNEIYVTIGRDYVIKALYPQAVETAKAVAATYPVEQIIVNREALRSAIEAALKAKLAKYFIVLEGVDLINIDFDPDFNKVVEQKQIEEQRIKTAEYVKLQAAQNKEATILNAEAKAREQELIKMQTTPQIVSLEWIKKWDGKLPITMLGDKASMLYSIGDTK